MTVRFWDDVVLFDSGKVAMHDDCCCDCPYALCGNWPSTIIADVSEPYLINELCNICGSYPTDLIFNKVSESFTDCAKAIFYELSSSYACGDGFTVKFTGTFRIGESATGASHTARVVSSVPFWIQNEMFMGETSLGWCQTWFYSASAHTFSPSDTCADFFPHELSYLSPYTSCSSGFGPGCSYYTNAPSYTPKVYLEL